MFRYLYPVFAVLAVHIGRSDPLTVLLVLPSYYTDLLFALLASYLAGWYIRWLNKALARKFDRKIQLSHKIPKQFLLGVLLPVFVIIGMEVMYLVLILDMPIENSSILNLELPLAFIFCVMANLIYLFLYQRLQHTRDGEVPRATPPRKYKTDFIVYRGSKSIILTGDAIAYFIILQKNTFLVGRDGQQYLFNHSLGNIGKAVSPVDYFLLNRQVLAHRTSIVSFERTATRKLGIILSPTPEKTVFVPKTRAMEFVQWLNGH